MDYQIDKPAIKSFLRRIIEDVRCVTKIVERYEITEDRFDMQKPLRELTDPLEPSDQDTDTYNAARLAIEEAFKTSDLTLGDMSVAGQCMRAVYFGRLELR